MSPWRRWPCALLGGWRDMAAVADAQPAARRRAGPALSGPRRGVLGLPGASGGGADRHVLKRAARCCLATREVPAQAAASGGGAGRVTRISSDDDWARATRRGRCDSDRRQAPPRTPLARLAQALEHQCDPMRPGITLGCPVGIERVARVDLCRCVSGRFPCAERGDRPKRLFGGDVLGYRLKIRGTLPRR